MQKTIVFKIGIASWLLSNWLNEQAVSATNIYKSLVYQYMSICHHLSSHVYKYLYLLVYWIWWISLEQFVECGWFTFDLIKTSWEWHLTYNICYLIYHVKVFHELMPTLLHRVFLAFWMAFFIVWGLFIISMIFLCASAYKRMYIFW